MSCELLLLMAMSAALAAGAAGAQPLDIRLPDRAQAPVAATPIGRFSAEPPRPDLANPLDPLAPTALQANPVASAVFAKTALDHRFARREDLTGSVGFLCGLQPGHNESGAAAAYGTDPHGRFLGARFSLAFR